MHVIDDLSRGCATHLDDSSTILQACITLGSDSHIYVSMVRVRTESQPRAGRFPLIWKLRSAMPEQLLHEAKIAIDWFVPVTVIVAR